MSRKRKATAVADADIKTGSTDPESEVAPTRRRLTKSVSRSAKNETETENDNKDGEGMGVRPKMAKLRRSSTTPQEIQEEMEEAKEGVQEAIRGLARMERRLQRDAKRQKLKVEASSLSAHADIDSEKAHKPPPGPNAGEVVEELSGIQGALPTPDKDTFDEAYGNESISAIPKEQGRDEELSEAIGRGATRAPPINSSYLPLPWRGRLGYACLNTYLRTARPPVFSSRTCRMASIIDHRHPLQHPSQPEHATKNRPDRTQTADPELGHRFVQELGLANARDIVKMLRWNDRYGIKFMRLSSEMFPFASHDEHGYKLAPFAAEVLAAAGSVAAELGHRLTTHPGQFTQLGSPRSEVIKAAVRDLEYHDEMLSLLKLPPQQNRDAVMILHMGGVYGDKSATIQRFRQNYTSLLSPSIKARLVLENDDVSWNVHELLPVCEELNIPLVLDYHHHNIVFDATAVREGTLDISQPAIMERIKATWTRKNIRQKMHYSEPCPGAVSARDRRKHSPRVLTLPPCPPDVDLMIEAKDKEQAVFELMRTFKLPGFERINDIIPHVREDQDRPLPKPPRKKAKSNGRKRKKNSGSDVVEENEDSEEKKPNVVEISAEEFAMGGPLGRVYWPAGMEEWLRPKKREPSKKTKSAGEEDDDSS